MPCGSRRGLTFLGAGCGVSDGRILITIGVSRELRMSDDGGLSFCGAGNGVSAISVAVLVAGAVQYASIEL